MKYKLCPKCNNRLEIICIVNTPLIMKPWYSEYKFRCLNTNCNYESSDTVFWKHGYEAGYKDNRYENLILDKKVNNTNIWIYMLLGIVVHILFIYIIMKI